MPQPERWSVVPSILYRDHQRFSIEWSSAASMEPDSLDALTSEIVACRKCTRLGRQWEAAARQKRAALREWEEWGRPVAGFGDAPARLLGVWLATAAPGGSRTGPVC